MFKFTQNLVKPRVNWDAFCNSARITKFVKKYLNEHVDNKIWGCLKIVIAIHNYSSMIMFTSIILFFLSTMVLIWSSCRFHFPFLTSPSLGSFSFSCWAHLLHFWQARFNNKYICPMWCFFLFLFPPYSSCGGFCKCFVTALALFCVLLTFLFFAIDFVVFPFPLSFIKSIGYLPS